MNMVSSNKIVEHDLEILNNIKPVEAPDYLFKKIINRFEQHKEQTLSLVWVQSIAAIFLCIFCIEVYLFNQSFRQKKENYQSLVEVPDNMMYHE